MFYGQKKFREVMLYSWLKILHVFHRTKTGTKHLVTPPHWQKQATYTPTHIYSRNHPRTSTALPAHYQKVLITNRQRVLDISKPLNALNWSTLICPENSRLPRSVNATVISLASMTIPAIQQSCFPPRNQIPLKLSRPLCARLKTSTKQL